MNPALAASGSGGLAAAVVTVLNGMIEHFFNIAPSVTFATAEITIATALAGVGAHYLTRPAAAPATPAAAPSSATGAAAAALLALVLAGSALSGCAQLGLTGDPKNDLPKISADILQTVNVACAEYAPVGALAVLVPDPKVQAIALTTNGVCDIATGQVIPGVASKLDASSAAWVGLSVGMLKALGVEPAAAPAPAAPAVPATPALKGA